MSVFHNSYGEDFYDYKQSLYFIADNEGQDWEDRGNYNNLTVVPFEATATRFLPTSGKEINPLSLKIQ